MLLGCPWVSLALGSWISLLSLKKIDFPAYLLTSQQPWKIPGPRIRFWSLVAPTADPSPAPPSPPAPHPLKLPSGCSCSFQAGKFKTAFLLQVPKARLRRSLTKVEDDKRLQHGYRWI